MIFGMRIKQQRQQQQGQLLVLQLLLLLCCTITAVESFGDALSGLTGRAPESLGFPTGLLDGTNIDPSRGGGSGGGADVDLRCVYKASRDGWSAIDFHGAVDSRGSALVVCLSRSGKRFGGYSPTGWMGTDDYVSSNAAFLWYQKGGGGNNNNNNNKAFKCPVLRGGNAALFDYASAGPVFGAADLKIGESRAAIMGGFAGPDMEDRSASAGNLKKGTSSIGGAYDDPTNGWPVRGAFELVELEVYANANIRPRGSDNGGSGGGGFFKWPF